MSIRLSLISSFQVVLFSCVLHGNPASADVFQTKSQAGHSFAATPQTSTEKWAWLQDTYWYVPWENLRAIVWFSSAPHLHFPVLDQTVWHIEEYRNGYFFGPVAISIDNQSPGCSYLIGSVTPNGKVNISFTPLEGNSEEIPVITTGIGEMVKTPRAKWTFNMQMSTPIPGGDDKPSMQIAHWAFMEQCRRDEHCWLDLPGVNIKPPELPELLNECSG